MIKELYKALSEKLATITELKSIDLFRNQFATWGQETVYDFPLAFLEFDCSFDNTTQNTQKGTATIKVHIATSFIGDTRKGSATQETALQCFDIAQTVHENLQGFEGTFFGSLSRTRLNQDQNPNAVYVIVQDYECEFVDTSTDTAKDRIEANPDILLNTTTTPTRIVRIDNPNS
ncbi:hypothetical protein V9L05_19965 [Bernardetia sp. Wsw4-3y2]|uniref:hypothetical protein n=1 Tax=Bernardetia sp. Wsw4-3y2 TaxID=3127471 RepID=UPI0030D59CC8